MTDDDILREFLTEYNLSDNDGKPTAYQELSMSRYPSLAEYVKPSTAAVKKFYKKHGIDFLKLFFNKTTIVKVWKEIKGEDQYGLSKLIGENIVLLENMDDPAAGELADIYLQSVKVIELDEDGWPDISTDFYYINSALRILLKHDLKKKADNHIKRLRENLYRYYPDDDLELTHGELLKNRTDEWILMSVQIHEIEAVDGAFQHILYNINTLFNEGGFSWHENIYNLLSEIITRSSECLQRVVKLELENYEDLRDKKIYNILGAKKHPLALEYFFSFWGASDCVGQGGLAEIPDIDFPPSNILDLVDPSRPHLFKGVICYLMGLDSTERKNFVDAFSDVSVVFNKFVDALSFIFANPSELTHWNVAEVAYQAGKLLQLSNYIPSIMKSIESTLKDNDWKRSAAAVFIAMALCSDITLQEVKKYNLMWLLEEINSQFFRDETSQNDKEEEIVSILSGPLFELLVYADEDFLEAVRSLVTDPQKLQGSNPANKKGGPSK